MKTILDEKSLENLYHAMNVQLADWAVLYTKLHNYHWFVKGPHFFTLHSKFEELYNEAAANIDEIAERLITIGGRPAATMKQYLVLSTIEEETAILTAEQMVRQLVKDLETAKGNMKEALQEAEELVDHPTVDLFVGKIEQVEKHIWMLNAFLG